MEEVKVEIKRYNPNYKSGLSEEEVNERISNNLINKDKTITKKSTLEIIVKNVFTFLNVVLFIIAIILMTFKQWTNCIFIVILLANLVIGLFQDFRAKKMVDKLSLMQKSKYTVIRNGKKVELYDNELVLDDVIILKGNDMIPCDSVVLEGSLQVNESVITGESKKIRKSYGDNLLSGSYVTSGEAYVRIDKIGEENYIKQLQLKSKEFKKPKSKLYVEINKIFKTITIIVVVLGLAQIIVTISTNLLNKELTYDVITKFIIVPISGAIISLIPSGMYLLFSTSLAAGVISLSKKNVLVQDMYSLDTLARVDTLCIDKTGTITDGTMVVSSYTIIDYFFENNVDFAEIMSAFTHLIGDTNFTAEALKSYFNSDYNYKKESVIHFDSENKFSAITFKDFGTIVVGAYGFIKINNDNIDIKNKLDELSKNATRVLIVAYSKKAIVDDKLPDDLQMIAYIELEDHIKEDAKEILKWFRNNDVEIKVISGDNELTVSKIAKEVGLADAINSISLDDKADQFVLKNASNYNVFGRTSPEQKKLIVESLRMAGHTVAMFGDGVNDILSFKQSDVSISVANGASAAKDLANLILTDNQFSGLPEIVAQGRRVINNLQRTCSLFLVKTTFSVIMNVFFLIFGLVTKVSWPFFPGSFYVWELCSIGFSAFFIALEPNNERIKGDFIKTILNNSMPYGFVIALITMISYMIFVGFHMFNGNQDIYRTIITYFISIASFFALIKTIWPLNKYRAIVSAVSFALGVMVFLWSIYNVNWLALYPMNQTPRYPTEDMRWMIAALVEIGFIAFVILSFVQYLLKKRGVKFFK